MSRVLIRNLPPGITIRDVDDFGSPFGRLLYVDVKNQGNSTLACVEYESIRNSQNLIRARHGHNYNGYTVQLKIMSEDSVSGPPEFRDNKGRRNSPAPSPSPSAWSRNNNQPNNRTHEIYDNSNGKNRKPSSNFDNDRGSYYNNNRNRDSVRMETNTGNSLDFNEACHIVYDSFLNQGYNPTLAKERTLEFVNNMQRRSNDIGGIYSNNSEYFGHGMNSNNNFGNDSGNFNGNQNWGRNADSFSNPNWGSFNDPKNQPSSWGSGGGMSHHMQGNGINTCSRRDGWNNGGTSVSDQGRVGGKQPIMAPQEPTPDNVVDHESYTKSATIRKKIEMKITQGISTPRDLEELQFHTQIMNDYKQHMHIKRKMGGAGDGDGVKVDPVLKLQQYTSVDPPKHLAPADHEIYAKDKEMDCEYEKTAEVTSKRKKGKDDKELMQLKQNRYKSALGIVKKFQKFARIPLKYKRTYSKSKSIVRKYEKSIEALAGGNEGTAVGESHRSDTKTDVGVSLQREVADASERVGFNSTSHTILASSQESKVSQISEQTTKTTSVLSVTHAGQADRKERRHKRQSDVRRRRYLKAKFVLDKIVKNAANGIVHERDEEDHKRYTQIVKEYEKMKGSQQYHTTLSSKRERSQTLGTRRLRRHHKTALQ